MSRRKPDRPDYLALESGGWRKKWKDRLPIALLYPNTYRLGMSNLGLQLVYELVNQHPEIVCERVFLPEEAGPARSVESGRRLTDFPVLLCSVSFEEDFPRLLAILRAGSIEPLAENRRPAQPLTTPGQPLIVGGGVATFINPEPLAPFMDLFVLGEAEAALPPVLAYLLRHLEAKPRQDLLWELAAGFRGCYVPQFYAVEYDPEGRLAAMTAPAGLPARVEKVIASASPAIASHSRVLTPETEFADLYLTELGRGCSRGCRFCAAGYVYRPPRLWSAQAILAALEERFAKVRRVGLLGMEMARPKELEAVSDYLLASGCALSFASLRADALTPGLLRLLAASRVKTAAIAPDGGSERLRQVINKGLTAEDLVQGAVALAGIGITNLKLYFMIGLPTEEQKDLEQLVDLTLRIKAELLAAGRKSGRVTNLTLSINSFVPKAWTPFQFHPMAPVPELKGKLKYLRQRLAGQANLRLKADNPEQAAFQALLARGDRRVGELLLSLAPGERQWRRLYRQHGVEPDDYLLRPRQEQELFPWEIIEHHVERRYLWAEYRRGLAGRSTAACEPAVCRRCGVCRD